MTRRTCGYAWPGQCGTHQRPGLPRKRTHECRRPPGHPDHHACTCGERP